MDFPTNHSLCWSEALKKSPDTRTVWDRDEVIHCGMRFPSTPGALRHTQGWGEGMKGMSVVFFMLSNALFSQRRTWCAKHLSTSSWPPATYKIGITFNLTMQKWCSGGHSDQFIIVELTFQTGLLVLESCVLIKSTVLFAVQNTSLYLETFKAVRHYRLWCWENMGSNPSFIIF